MDENENIDGSNGASEDQNTLENRKVDIQEYHKARLAGLKMSMNQYLRQKQMMKKGRLSTTRINGKKTSKIDFVFMLGVAGFFDLISGLINLIPGIGGFMSTIFITPTGTFILWFMYKKRGIEFKSAKSIAKFGGASLIELVPVLNVLPGFILNVLLNYGGKEAKEMVGNTVPGAKSLMN
jgi:hypothetical protein